MKWLFARTQPSATLFEGMTAQELREVAAALQEVASRGLFGSAPLVISPGSSESKAFLDNLAELNEELGEGSRNPRAIRTLQVKVRDVQISFGEWQRGQAKQTISEFTQSLESLVGCVESGLADQESSGKKLEKMSQSLDDARSCEDIARVREILRREVETAKEILLSQAASQKQLKEKFSQAVEVMQVRIKKAEQVAQTDHLTSLGNRAAFDFHSESAFQKVKAGERPYCLAVFDLDEFKSVNDRFGHAMGDQLLSTFADRLRAAFPPPSFAGRFGGDEFAVVAHQHPVEAKKRIERAARDLESSPLTVDVDGFKRSLPIKFSFGVVEYLPGKSASETLAAADEAMYQHKQLRKQGDAA